MAVLADLTYKDSRTMRIATVIAMFYLPANLVMVCFLYLSTARKLHKSFTHLPFGGSVRVRAYQNSINLCCLDDNHSPFSVARLSGSVVQSTRQTTAARICKSGARYGLQPWRQSSWLPPLLVGLCGGTPGNRESRKET